MGRHSRKGAAPQGSRKRTGAVPGGPVADPSASGAGGRRGGPGAAPGSEQHAGPRDGTPAHGVPGVRGGHPEQRESGGGWGSAQRYGDWVSAPDGAPQPTGGSCVPGPRREFVDAFEAFDTGSVRAVTLPRPETASGPGTPGGPGGGPEAGEPGAVGKGRAMTGIAAAAIITVLAVVVAGQVTGGGATTSPSAKAADGTARGAEGDITSRAEGRPTPPRPSPPSVETAPVLTYAQLITRQFPLEPKLKASGKFSVVPGFDKAPGQGQKFRYRVDVESGLGLDGALFAQAVQQTLNDDRSWAHDGAKTFERISSGKADFVLTLASPGTTAFWCAKSGLDTTVDNVSCDSASTDRVMINAFRWAQGSSTYGAKAMLTYRQMLINHEVGHRLGHNHVSCGTPGALAPVMQQQTKSLDIDGIKCKPNPWAFPTR